MGRFGRTRGVAGEIYVQPLTDFPDRFKGSTTVWVESEKGWEELMLVSSRWLSGKLAVKINGVDCPEEAKRYTGWYLYIKGADLRELPEGEYYHFELVGCHAVDTNGENLGIVTAVEQYPANDVLVIEDKQGKQYLLPMIAAFVAKVDLERKVIHLDPPEGIFESPDEN